MVNPIFKKLSHPTSALQNRLIILVSAVSILSQCDSLTNYNNLDAFTSENRIQMVVEIPAGTNDKIEYDASTNTFPQDTENGIPRVINFLPYPGNYGFIPGTEMEVEQGGDGDALDILLLCGHQPTGAVLEVIPIGILRLKDNGEEDHKVVAVPADESLRTIQATNFLEFMIEYDAARRQVEEWFLYYKGWGEMELIGWEDEKEALLEIRKWHIN